MYRIAQRIANSIKLGQVGNFATPAEDHEFLHALSLLSEDGEAPLLDDLGYLIASETRLYMLMLHSPCAAKYRLEIDTLTLEARFNYLAKKASAEEIESLIELAIELDFNRCPINTHEAYFEKFKRQPMETWLLYGI